VAKRLARHFTFGRSRLLTPVLPDQVSPHHHIVVCLISQISRMLGQYQPLSTYHLPSAAPILTVPIPNLSVSVAEKALESLSSPPPFGREWKMYPPSEHRGQASSAPLCSREVAGSNPGAAWPGVGFFRDLPPHHHIEEWKDVSFPFSEERQEVALALVTQLLPFLNKKRSRCIEFGPLFTLRILCIYCFANKPCENLPQTLFKSLLQRKPYFIDEF
jgi:hypothetical protein